MTRKEILFDLDGTLTDSGEGIMRCARRALEILGVAYHDKILYDFVGPPLQVSFRALGLSEDRVEEGVRLFRERYFTEGKFENFPYPGIRELLERLHAEGYKLYVATSKVERIAVEVLEHFDLLSYFDGVFGATESGVRTSKEMVIRRLIDMVGGLEAPVMIGDTRYDIIGANEMGMPSIGVKWGYGDCEEMRFLGAVAVVSDMDELYRAISAL